MKCSILDIKIKKKLKKATVIKILTLTMFSTHIYTFGGKVYKQLEGGPIGLRSTCSVARLAMKVWDDKWLRRLEMLRIKIEAATRYMDDGRTLLHPFHHGDGQQETRMCNSVRSGGRRTRGCQVWR